MENFDVGIIGVGVAGTFAALRMADKHPGTKTIVFDLGRPPGKRRRQLEGFLGCFPAGDGKLYPGDADRVANLVDGRKIRHAYGWLTSYMNQFGDLKLIKDPLPNQTVQKKAKAAGFEIQANDYFQWKPDSIHSLAKDASLRMEEAKIQFSFDNQVLGIIKKKGIFTIKTEMGEYNCKQIILAVGRSGWRWITDLFNELGIKYENDFAYYGLRFEISGQYLKDFNKSHCTFTSSDLEVGPFSWNGTVIPEDHADLVISSFRSNEERWKTEKVSFNLTKKVSFPGQGVLQSDRLGKLVFLLFNDRVSKEKIKMIIKNQSQLNILPEFSWLKKDIELIDGIIPDLINKGNFHVPHLNPIPVKVELESDLQTQLSGLYLAGESAGVFGIMAAALSGIIAADSVNK